jgi:hypothetical protein
LDTRSNNDETQRAADNGFEIRGIPDDLITRYSQRGRHRDKAIDQFVARTARRPTDNEIAILIRDSRPHKLVEISAQEVRRRQLSRLIPEESRTLCGMQREAGGSLITFDQANNQKQKGVP